MSSSIFITLLVCMFIRDSLQCSCAGGGSGRTIDGEYVLDNLCDAETLIEAKMEDVSDGPEGYLEYAIEVVAILRGDLNDVSYKQFLYTELPDPMCALLQDMILFVGETYILSVGKINGYLILNMCQYASDSNEVTHAQRKIMRNGCP